MASVLAGHFLDWLDCSRPWVCPLLNRTGQMLIRSQIAQPQHLLQVCRLLGP